MRDPGRPRVLAILPHFIPSTILTVVKPLTALHRARDITADITLESWVSAAQIARADVVVLCRNNEPRYGWIAEVARARRIPMIYELDDNFFELPAAYAREGQHFTPDRFAQFEAYVRAAAVVRVYSEPLRLRCQQLNPSVCTVDGPIDWGLVPATPPRRDPTRVSIVYPTSRIREDALAALFTEELREVLDRYRGHVELVCWGHHPAALRGHPGVRLLDFVSDYDRFFRRFAGAGFDIGLAPLHDDVFHRSKSNNKFREYAAARVAGVYYAVDVYTRDVRDGETGLLVTQEPGSWFRAVSRLIENPDLRAHIQTQAFAHARAHYGLAFTQAVWLEHLHAVMRPSARDAGPVMQGVGGDIMHAEVGARVGQLARWVIHMIKAMRQHGRAATMNRIRRTTKDWRLLARAKWQLRLPRPPR